jgi:adenine-specific DNA-methyltransferase
MYIARELRREATPAEIRAWEILRGRRCLDLKFRRQFPYGGFILDFFCRELWLDLEVDGSVHDEPANRVHDEARDEYLRASGLRVIRIRNEEVSRDHLEKVLKDVPPLRVRGEGDRG